MENLYSNSKRSKIIHARLQKKEPVKTKLSLDKVKLWMSYSEESGDQGADPGPVITVKQVTSVFP